jgi:hypothetical protein
MTGADTARIRELMDQARQSFCDSLVLVTPDVLALDATDAILLVVQSIRLSPQTTGLPPEKWSSLRYGFQAIELIPGNRALDRGRPPPRSAALFELLSSSKNAELPHRRPRLC